MVAKIVGLKSVVRPLGVMFLVTGLFVSAVLKAETVSINFREADIRSVIEAVAEITGKSFVLDPRVRGEITIISPEPIESELLYEAVLSALQVQGFQAVDDGAVIRVVPFAKSFQIPSGVMGSELQTKVIRVNHVRANELLPVLKPMMSRGSLLQAYDAGNNLVATDTVSQIAQLERVLAEIDVPEQSAIDVINLRHISAAEALHIASQMQNLQQQNLSIVEDSFNNRIIVGGPRTGRAAFREMLSPWMFRLIPMAASRFCISIIPKRKKSSRYWMACWNPRRFWRLPERAVAAPKEAVDQAIELRQKLITTPWSLPLRPR